MSDDQARPRRSYAPALVFVLAASACLICALIVNAIHPPSPGPIIGPTTSTLWWLCFGAYSFGVLLATAAFVRTLESAALLNMGYVLLIVWLFASFL